MHLTQIIAAIDTEIAVLEKARSLLDLSPGKIAKSYIARRRKKPIANPLSKPKLERNLQRERTPQGTVASSPSENLTAVTPETSKAITVVKAATMPRARSVRLKRRSVLNSALSSSTPAGPVFVSASAVREDHQRRTQNLISAPSPAGTNTATSYPFGALAERISQSLESEAKNALSLARLAAM
jgi:hypothetical protein